MEVKTLSKVDSIEKIMAQIPGAMFGDCLPLKHTFNNGIYVREIFIPKGFLIVSKIHKFSHPVFVMKGDISIMTDEGYKRIVAPCNFISPVGAKRIGFAHEDTIWVTIHKTEETDLVKIEEELIAKDRSCVPLTIEEENFIERVNLCHS